MLKENLKNIFYQFIAQIIPRAILLIFTFYLASYLGSNEYGKFDFAISFGYLIGAFFELGGNMSLTKHVARGLLGVYGYSLRLRVFSILIAFAVLIGVMLITGLYSDIFYHIIFGVLGIAMSSLMNLYFAFFRGVRKMNYEAVVLIIQKVLFVLVCVLLLSNSKNSFFAVEGFAISMAVSFLLILYIFRKKKSVYAKDFITPIPSWQKYYADIGTLALVEIFGIANFRVTQIILKSFASYHDVGVYAISYKLIEILVNVPGILMIVFFPGFAKLAVENMDRFRERFAKVFTLLLLLGFISAGFCWMFGKMFFSIIGKEYDEAYLLVRYMSVALIVMFPNYLLSQSLIAMDKNIRYSFVMLVTVLSNILLGLILVPRYGSTGSAITVVVCEYIIFIGGLILILYEFNKQHQHRQRIPLLLRLIRSKFHHPVIDIDRMLKKLKPNKLFKGLPKKILLFRFDRIGDAVVTIPVIRDLKLNYPGIELHVLASKKNSFVFRSVDCIDKLIVLDEEAEAHYIPTFLRFQLLSYFWFFFRKYFIPYIRKQENNLIAKLKAEHYDAVIDLVGDKKLFLLTKLISNYSVGSRIFILSLIYSYQMETGWVDIQDEDFMAKKIEESITAPLGLLFQKREFSLPFIPFHFTEKKTEYDVLLHLGGSEIRKLEVKKEIKLIESLEGKKIIITDGDETPRFKQYREYFSHQPDTVFKLYKSLEEMRDDATRSRLLVCYDGGQAHYISQYVKSIIIFGAASHALWKPYEFEAYEFYRRWDNGVIAEKSKGKLGHIILYYPVWCRPCFDVGCKTKPCLQNIHPEQLLELITDNLKPS